MLVLDSLVGFHRTVSFSFFSVTGRGIDLDYRAIAWFALEMNRDLDMGLAWTLNSIGHGTGRRFLYH